MRRGIIAALFTAALGVSACAYYDDYAVAAERADHMRGYAGSVYASWAGPAYFTGSGAAALDPWLAGTIEGRRLVSARFDARRDRHLGLETARHANGWFRRRADVDGDRRLTDAEIRRALSTTN